MPKYPLKEGLKPWSKPSQYRRNQMMTSRALMLIVDLADLMTKSQMIWFCSKSIPNKPACLSVSTNTGTKGLQDRWAATKIEPDKRAWTFEHQDKIAGVENSLWTILWTSLILLLHQYLGVLKGEKEGRGISYFDTIEKI